MMNAPPRSFTHGDIVRWRRVGGLLFAEVAYAPGQRIPPHTHPHARFVLVLKGSLTEIRAGVTVTHYRSTLLFRCAGEPHSSLVPNSGATCLVVDADDGWFARAQQHARVLTKSAHFRRGFVLHLAHRLYGEFRLRDEVSRLAIESIALGVMAEASRRVAQQGRRTVPLWLQHARLLVEQGFTERLPLAAVAERVGVHPVHLARSFRRCYRMTVGCYVRQLRVEFARDALTGSTRSLSEIALDAGFCDQSHFSRSFKRHTGLTPAEYRLTLQFSR